MTTVESLLNDFKTFFPEFDAVEDKIVCRYLDRCRIKLNAAAWGTHIDEAIILHACHELALSQQRRASSQVDDDGNVVVTGGSGAITSSSVGGISVSFATPSQATSASDGDAWFAQTPYGQNYLTLREHCILPINRTGSEPLFQFLL